MSHLRNIVVISDTHCGCQLGLCPAKVKFDHGGDYGANRLQLKMLDMWNHFWHVWVPRATEHEPYIVVHNGDIIDGRHHRTTHQITQNLADQQKIALAMLKPVVKNPKCAKYFQIRGTDVHSGESGEVEETIAGELGAEIDEFGNHSRFELWLKMDSQLIHFTHHVGMTSSTSYESTAVHKELVEAYVEAGRWGHKPPNCIVRSHRHRHYGIDIAAHGGSALGIVTPAWQLKIPFVYKVVLGRSSTPQVGGVLIRCGEEEPIYTRKCIWSLERTKTVTI